MVKHFRELRVCREAFEAAMRIFECSKRPRLNPLLFMGIIGMFTIGANFAMQLYRGFYGNQDIWWTAKTMRLGIEDSEGSFELFIGGKLLQKHLADGSLFAVDSNGEQHRVVAKDLAVRLNNWHKVRCSILANGIVSGIAFGVVVTVLVVGVVQVCGRKRLPGKPDTGEA